MKPTPEQLRKYKKMKELQGNQVNLQKTTLEHTEGLYTQIQSAGVLENLTIEIEDLRDFRRYILFIENQWHMNQDFTYTIFNKKKQIVGQISIYNLAFIHNRGEIGIWIGHEYWNKGYGKDALQTIVQYGFKGLHLNRLQAHMFINNTCSIALFESVGFHHEGIIREYVKKLDTYRDVYSYALLAKDFTSFF